MPAFRPSIIDNPLDVARRLADFGLTVLQILSIRDAARAAHDDASPLMPLNAPGTLGYIFGVEALRGNVLDDEWQMDRTLGVEAVINRKLGVRIGYQNVDRACDLVAPMPRSAKGTATERMCGMPLFEHFGMVLETDQDRIPRNDFKDPLADQVTTYFVMVGEDGSVELSSPIIANQRYVGFRERIYVDRPGDDWESDIEPEVGPVDDFEVSVTFKDNA